jgi:hypothetical protein
MKKKRDKTITFMKERKKIVKNAKKTKQNFHTSLYLKVNVWLTILIKIK